MNYLGASTRKERKCKEKTAQDIELEEKDTTASKRL